MKTIGLLGGTAWVSTIEYYRRLNQKVNARLGKNHSAKIILSSIDYETIKKFNYENWEKIGEVLLEEILKLDSCNVDCILICNNTLHKAYDTIAPHLSIETPVLHIVDCVANHIKQQNMSNILLLGTKFTMEDGFYHKRLENFGIKVVTPDESERNEVQRISQEEISREIFSEASKEWFKKVISKYACEGVILGCTELPLLITQKDYQVPIFNTLDLHCEKAVEFALFPK